MDFNTAIILPTYKRPEKIAKVIKNLTETTKFPYELYFCIEPTDYESLGTIHYYIKDNVHAFVFNTQSAIKATNRAFHLTKEPYVYMACDDLEWTEDWLNELINYKINSDSLGLNYKVIATVNGYTNNDSGFWIERKYIEQFSGVMDCPNKVLNENYHHYGADSEFKYTAKKRGMYGICEKAVVKHHHYHFDNTVEYDETYKKNEKYLKEDQELFDLRICQLGLEL